MRKLAIVAIVIVASVIGYRRLSASGTAVRGEIVETYCWSALQVGGPAHAQCGIACARRGIPIALYDASSHKAFVLLPGRDKTTLPPPLVAAMGKKVTVRGDVISRGGMSFLTVKSWDAE